MTTFFTIAALVFFAPLAAMTALVAGNALAAFLVAEFVVPKDY